MGQVTFAIGEDYKDIVWCNVLPMFSADILLGRLWMYQGLKNRTRNLTRSWPSPSRLTEWHGTRPGRIRTRLSHMRSARYVPSPSRLG